MIPTVEDILKMLLARQCTHEQAMAWMEEHFASAIEQGERQSLSQEAVRDEALECEAELTGILHRELLDTQLVTVEQWNTEIAPALSKLRNSIERALKREPNAEGK